MCLNTYFDFRLQFRFLTGNIWAASGLHSRECCWTKFASSFLFFSLPAKLLMMRAWRKSGSPFLEHCLSGRLHFLRCAFQFHRSTTCRQVIDLCLHWSES